MKRWMTACVAAGLLAGGAAWAVPVEYSDFCGFGGGIHVGDHYEWMSPEFFWEQSVDLTIDPNAIISAWLILDTARVHQSSDPVLMGSVSISVLSGGSSIPVVIGYLTPNPDQPEIDTTLALDGQLLMSLAQQGGGNVQLGVQSALITPDNYDDFNLYSSRLVIWYDDGNGPVVPEPGTVALIGLGTLLSIAARHRRTAGRSRR